MRPDIDAIRRRCEAFARQVGDESDYSIESVLSCDEYDEACIDLWVHARTDIPALIAHVAALEAALDEAAAYVVERDRDTDAMDRKTRALQARIDALLRGKERT